MKARDRILKASLRVFARDGFFKATMDEIARVAGLAKGTIYHYFPSKEELIIQSVKDISSKVVERFEEGRNLEEKLLNILDFFIENPEVFKVFFEAVSFSFRRKGRRVSALIGETLKNMKDQVTEVMRNEGLPTKLSEAVAFHFLGIATYLFLEEHSDPEGLKNEISKFLKLVRGTMQVQA